MEDLSFVGVWLSRFMHVAAAIVGVGGTCFVRFVLLPSANAALNEEEHARLRLQVMAAWKQILHLAVGLLMLSGFINFFIALPKHRGDGLYHALIGTKILVAFVIFFLAMALTGKSAAFEPIRKNSKKWLAITITLAAIVVGISGFLKVRPPFEKKADTVNKAEAAATDEGTTSSAKTN